jgi:spore germination protein
MQGQQPRRTRVVLLAGAWVVMMHGLACSAVRSADVDTSQKLGFNEVWGYVYKGAEKALTGPEPITDVGYFSAAVNDVGRLDPAPLRPVLAGSPGRIRRVHLVISAPANKSLMYWCLGRDIATRDGLIGDIVAACAGFDGVQIDFEGIRAEDRGVYLSFLSKLKTSLARGKILSVAVLARTRNQEDAFDYPAISAIADRVIVMAYDEHWRTGAPGPIASTAWCRRVSTYARQTIPGEKLVMGLPLYGRAWQVESLAQALTWDQTQRVLKQLGRIPSRAEDGTPFFEYEQPATLKVYYEDVQSLSEKLNLYHDLGVQAVAFWRVGQGPQTLWQKVETVN